MIALKRMTVMLLVVLLLFETVHFHADALSAHAAVCINGDTGEVIFSRNADERLPMASTTKIMTALLLCEQNSLEREVVVTHEMVAVEGSSMGLLVGDTVSFRGLLYGMLLASGNDAANTAAIAIDGSVEAFVERMNLKAREIGLVDTNFVTPSGLDAKEHYTTARELALLARYALKNEDFAEAASSQYEALYYGNPPYRRTLKNHNRLLSMYDGTIGVKTGFTKKSGRCLVSAAKKNGEYVIAVTLNASDDWNDHIQLLDLGFSEINTSVLSEKEVFCIPLTSCDGVLKVGHDALSTTAIDINAVSKTVSLPHFVYGEVVAGEAVGQIVFSKNGEEIAKSDIVALNDVPKCTWDEKKLFFDIFLNILSFF